MANAAAVVLLVAAWLDSSTPSTSVGMRPPIRVGNFASRLVQLVRPRLSRAMIENVPASVVAAASDVAPTAFVVAEGTKFAVRTRFSSAFCVSFFQIAPTEASVVASKNSVKVIRSSTAASA